VPGRNKTSWLKKMFLYCYRRCSVVFAGLYWYFFIQSLVKCGRNAYAHSFTSPDGYSQSRYLINNIHNARRNDYVPAAGDPSVIFKNAISAQPNITPGTLTLIGITSGASGSAQSLTIPGLFNRFVASYHQRWQRHLVKIIGSCYTAKRILRQ